MQQQEDEREGEEAEAAAEADSDDFIGPASWQPQQQLDSAFHAAALIDATCYADATPDLIFPLQQPQQQQGQEQPAGGGDDSRQEGHLFEPAAPGDVHTAMARDLAEYKQEVAAQQQQQEQQQQQQQRGVTTQAGAGRGAASFAADVMSPAPRDSSRGEAGRHGRGRGRWGAPGRGFAGEGADRGQVQQMPMPSQARPQQQQQQREASKGESVGPPVGWQPVFSHGRSTCTVTAEDFLGADQPDPAQPPPVLTPRDIIYVSC
jgi:hypothetical protein